MIVHLVVFGGLFNGKQSYLRQGLVVVELVTTLIIVIFHMFSISNLSYLNAIRALRAFTLVKTIFQHASVNTIVTSLVNSLPSIFNLLIIEILLFFALSTICVRFFRGGFFSCDMTNIPRRSCTKPGNYHSQVVTSSDCIDFGGDWMNSVLNFDNVFNGIAILFQLLTTDAWTDVMFKMVDFAGANKVPISQNNFMWSYFAMVLVVISNFLILNFFAGVLMDTFTNEKNKLGGFGTLSNTQKQWVDLQSFIIHQTIQSKARKPSNKFRLFLFNFWKSKVWMGLNSSLIIISALAFWMVYHRQSEAFYTALTVIQIVTFFFFFVEISLKFATYGVQFVRDRSLLVDLLILCIEGVYLPHLDRLDHPSNWQQ